MFFKELTIMDIDAAPSDGELDCPFECELSLVTCFQRADSKKLGRSDSTVERCGKPYLGQVVSINSIVMSC